MPIPHALPARRLVARLAAGLVAAALTTATLVVVGAVAPAAARAVDPSTLLASYDFGATQGTTVPDSSGHGYDATVKGTGATVSGDALTLPGGASGSTAGYVQLPTGLFDGRNTLTLSVWLKNGTGSGNYAAMFFGTTENLPSQYFLLNPANPSGRFKSVITDGLSTGSPWTTETGISPTTASRGINGPVTDANWAMYTTVITPTSITGYLNDTKIGTVATTRTVSQFGSNLVAYLGRSSYADAFYKGGIRDLSVYTSALTDADVQGLYSSGLVTDAEAVQLDRTALAIPNLDDVRGNITLPTTRPERQHRRLGVLRPRCRQHQRRRHPPGRRRLARRGHPDRHRHQGRRVGHPDLRRHGAADAGRRRTTRRTSSPTSRARPPPTTRSCTSRPARATTRCPGSGSTTASPCSPRPRARRASATRSSCAPPTVTASTCWPPTSTCATCTAGRTSARPRSRAAGT